MERRKSLLLQKYRDDKRLSTTSFLLSDDGGADGDGKDEAARETEIARSVLFARGRSVAQHFADVRGVAISPFFADIYATFGDWRFSIWRHNALIFASPYCSSYIVCGCWSPSRPSVVLTAKHDGTVDIWDLLDQTHCAVFRNSPVSSTAITALRFNARNPQQLAVADAAGNLRILQIPRNFTVPLSDERRHIARFFRAEERKMCFVRKRRLRHRRATLEAESKQKAADEKEQETDAQPYDAQNDAAMEAKYIDMLAAFKKKLGIKDAA